MKFKVGVNLNGIKPIMLRAMADVEEAYLEVTGIQPTMTSALDSHTTGLHPKGYAGDFRINDIHGADWMPLKNAIDAKLNPRYGMVKFFDVILEVVPGQEHIHVEYDPKIRSEP